MSCKDCKCQDRKQIGNEVFEVYSKSYVDGLIAKVNSLSKCECEIEIWKHPDFVKVQNSKNKYKNQAREFERRSNQFYSALMNEKAAYNKCKAKKQELQEKLAIAERMFQNLHDFVTSAMKIGAVPKIQSREIYLQEATAEQQAEKGEGNEQ